MNATTVQQTLQNVNALYETTMELYESYFKALQTAIDRTSLSDLNRLNELYKMAEEASMALELDMGIFDKAMATDAENLTQVQDQLKIQSLYQQLQT